MKRSLERPGPSRQRGWIGLVVLLVALVIVGMLAKTALKQYGLLDGAAPASRATPVGQSPQDAAVDPPSPRNAMERAKGLEQSVQQQANDLNQRIDEASKVK